MRSEEEKETNDVVMSALTPEIYCLDLANLDKLGVFVFIGRRKSGKTVMLLHYMRTVRHDYDYVLVLSPSKPSLRDFAEVVPSLFCHDTWDPDYIEHVYNEQEKVFETTGKRMLLVIDDFGYKRKKVFNSPIFQKLLMNARHAGICLAFTLQDAVSLEGDGPRGQIDYVFMAPEKAPNLRKRLRDLFNVCFDPPKLFDQAFVALTQNYSQMIVIQADTGSMEVSDNVFWHKAHTVVQTDKHGNIVYNEKGEPKRRVPEFKFAPHSEIWQYHAENYDENHDSRSTAGAMNTDKTLGVRKISEKQTMRMRKLGALKDQGTHNKEQLKKKKKKKKKERKKTKHHRVKH